MHLVHRVIMWILFVDIQMEHPALVSIPHHLFPHCFITENMDADPHAVIGVYSPTHSLVVRKVDELPEESGIGVGVCGM
jgi:hypothetical protein